MNWWLVTKSDGLIAIDAGLPGHAKELEKRLREEHLGLSDVQACLLTHADVDHIGVAETLRRDGRVDVFLHPEDEEAGRGPARELPQEFLDNLGQPYLQETVAAYQAEGALEPAFLTETLPLEDGAELELPGRPTVRHCPGHTPGSCSFYLPEDDVLFTGDALVTVNVITGEPGPQLMPQFDNDDQAQALEALEVLAETEAFLVLPGHGEPWTGGVVNAVREARARLR